MDSMDSEIPTCTQLCKNLNAVPFLKEAKMFISGKDLYIRTSRWSQNFVSSAKSVYVQDYYVNKDSLSLCSKSIPSDKSSIHLQVSSRSGSKLILLREKLPSGAFYLEVWNGLKNELSIDLTNCKEHGKINVKECFKCFELSSNEKFLLYTAESKQPKSVSYFEKIQKEENANIIRDEEYAYRESWGETYEDVHHSVLCVMNLETGTIDVLPTSQISGDVSIGEAKWGPNDRHVFFIGWNDSVYRLGIWAFRDPSNSVYSMDLETKVIERLTNDDDICVRSLRFSPDFKTLIYLDETGTGFKGSRLRKYNLKEKEHSTILEFVENPRESYFPGIYTSFLPLRCWSADGVSIFLSSLWSSHLVIVSVNVENGLVWKVELAEEFGSASVLDVYNDVILAEVLASNIEPTIIIGNINKENTSKVCWKKFLPLAH